MDQASDASHRGEPRESRITALTAGGTVLPSGRLDGQVLQWSHFCGFFGEEDVRELPLTGSRGWTLISVEPLTISPSIRCGNCGEHGFIRDGQWVSA